MTNPNAIFSIDWTSQYTDSWSRHLDAFKGLKGVRALEIGCFQGRSSLWFLENILTGEGSTLTVVDNFIGHIENGPDEIRQTMEAMFDQNLWDHLYNGKLLKEKGDSDLVLPRMWVTGKGGFNFIYLDGSHDPKDVWLDLVMAWKMLSPGGILIIDDYNYKFGRRIPKMAINPFMDVFGTELMVLQLDWQVVLRKEFKNGEC